MKTHKMILFICLAQAFLSGCHKKSSPIEDNSFRIKVYNSSNYTLKNISFLLHGGSLEIKEDLISGNSSSIYKYELDRKVILESNVYSLFSLDIEDYGNFDSYMNLTDSIINNVYVDSVNVERGSMYYHIE